MEYFELCFQNDIKGPKDSLTTVETSSTKIKTTQSVHIPEKNNGENQINQRNILYKFAN